MKLPQGGWESLLSHQFAFGPQWFGVMPISKNNEFSDEGGA